MNSNLEAQLNRDLFLQLVQVLGDLFQSPKSEPETTFAAIIRAEEQGLIDISRQACKISYTIQHDVVSCRTKVAVASSKDSEVLGTYAFGIERVLGLEHTMLIETKVISPKDFLP